METPCWFELFDSFSPFAMPAVLWTAGFSFLNLIILFQSESCGLNLLYWRSLRANLSSFCIREIPKASHWLNADLCVEADWGRCQRKRWRHSFAGQQYDKKSFGLFGDMLSFIYGSRQDVYSLRLNNSENGKGPLRFMKMRSVQPAMVPEMLGSGFAAIPLIEHGF